MRVPRRPTASLVTCRTVVMLQGSVLDNEPSLSAIVASGSGALVPKSFCIGLTSFQEYREVARRST